MTLVPKELLISWLEVAGKSIQSSDHLANSDKQVADRRLKTIIKEIREMPGDMINMESF